MKEVLGFNAAARPALLIMECQKGIVGADMVVPGQVGLAQQVHERGILPRIAELADAFRAAGLPVILNTIVPRKDYVGWAVNCRLAAILKKNGIVYEGSPGAEIVDELAPKPGDLVVSRSHGMSMFHGTELEWHLRGLGVSTVVLAGVSTNIALPTSAGEAVARMFQVIMPEDCTAGATPESHKMAVEFNLPNIVTMTTSDLLRAQLASW